MQWLLQVALSNVAVTAVLAIVVWAIGRVYRKPALLHCLWVLVLLKLITPPLFHLPLPVAWELNGEQPPSFVPASDAAIETAGGVTEPAVSNSRRAEHGILATPPRDDVSPAMASAAGPSRSGSSAEPVVLTLDTGWPTRGEPGTGPAPVDAERLVRDEPPPRLADAETATGPASASMAVRDVLARAVAGVWLFGIMLTSILACCRTVRFHRLLRRAIPAGDGFGEECGRLARQLGLRRVPRVLLVSGPVSPMLWPSGLHAMILFPLDLAAQLDRTAREALLLHELAHYRRGDHWIRWLEMVVSCLYWWNPIVRLARRELHREEEECCDAWVVSHFPGSRRTYATALVQTIDFLSAGTAGMSVPPLGSGVAYFRDVQQRLKQIMTGSASGRLSGWGKLAIAAAAMGVLPLLPTLEAQPPVKPAAAALPDSTSKAAGDGAEAARASTAPPSPAEAEPTEFEDRPIELKGDDQEVRSIAVSPDGKYLLAGYGRWDTAGLVRLFNRESGREVVTTREPRGIASVAFSPDGQSVAWSTWHEAVAKIADPQTLVVRHVLRTGGVARVAFSPDGKSLASASEKNRLALWDVVSGEQIRSFDDTFRLHCVCFSPDGTLILAGGGSFSQQATGELAVWDVNTGRRITRFSGHTQPILGVAFSPDEKTAASSSLDGTARLWNVADGQQIRVVEGHGAGLEQIQFSPDGQRLATSAMDRTARLWDAASGAPLAVLPHDDVVVGIAFTPDGKTLASGGRGAVVRLWKVADATRQAVLAPDRSRDEPSAVVALAHSPDGRWIATSHDDNTIRLRDTSGDVIATIIKGHEDVAASLAFSPDSTTLATASFDGTVKLWDCRLAPDKSKPGLFGEPLATLSGHDNWVMSVAFSPDGKLLATGSYDKTIRLWELTAKNDPSAFGVGTTGNAGNRSGKRTVTAAKEAAVLKGHAAAVRSISFSPDGKLLAAGSSDRTTSVWDVAQRKQVATLKAHTAAVRAVAFSPDGTTLATAGEDKSIFLWDVAAQISNEESEIANPKKLAGHAAMVWCLAFSPRGGVLASGGLDNEIRLWDPRTGAQRATLKGHSDVVTTLAFAPDTSRLISAGYDRSIKVWPSKGPPIPTASPLATIAGTKDGLLTIAISPAGRWLAAAGKAREVLLLDLRTGKVARKLNDHQASAAHIAFSPDGRWLAAGLYGGGIAVWDLDTGKPATILKQHTGAVRRVAFSQDSRVLLSGGEDKTVKIWNVAAAKLLHTTEPQEHAISDVAFSPDGNTFAVSTGHWRQWQTPGMITLWDAKSFGPIGVVGGHEREIKGLTFSSSGDQIVSHGPGSLRIWQARAAAPVPRNPADPRYETELAPLPTDATITAAVLLADGRLASGDAKGLITVWNLDARQAVLRCEGHTDSIYSLAASPDGSLLTSVGRDGSLKLWSLVADRTRRPLNAGSYAMAVAVSPDGGYVATASSQALRLFEFASGRLVRDLKGHDGNVTGVKFTPDGRRIVSCGGDGSVRVWEVESGEQTLRMDGHTSNVRGLAVSPDGRFALSGGLDNVAVLWDLETGREVQRVTGTGLPVWSTAFSPDGKLAACGTNTNVQLWSVETGEPVRALPTGATVTSISFTPDGKRVVTSHVDTRAAVWDVATGKQLRLLEGHTDRVQAAHLLADGKTVLTTGGDGRILQWGIDSEDPPYRVATLDGDPQTVRLLSLTTTPDDGLIVTSGVDGQVRFWDRQQLTSSTLADRVRRWQPDGLTAEAKLELARTLTTKRAVWFATFSPDGKWLAIGGADAAGLVRLYDAQSLEQVAALKCEAPLLMHATFSPDSKQLAVGAGAALQMWDVAEAKRLYKLPGHTKGIRMVSFSPDGSRVATVADDGTLIVRDAAGGKERIRISGESEFYGVAFTRDGRLLVTGGGDWRKSKKGELQLWDAETGESSGALPDSKQVINSLALSADGRLLAARNPAGKIGIWNLDSRREEGEIARLTSTRALAFSPDGRLLAATSATNSGVITIVARETGMLVAEAAAHTGPVFAITFSPDGRYIVSAGHDGTAKFWTLSESGTEPAAAKDNKTSE